MAVVFTVTGITFTPEKAKAATWESPTDNDGYIRWNGKSESQYWGVATWAPTKSYSYDYTHDGKNSLIAVRNDNAVNTTVTFGSPKRTYDAQTEYYFRYVIHSSTAFTSAVYFDGYYADWGEKSLGNISFNAGDTIITGSKTTANNVTTIATSLKIANLPIGTTVSIDEYYFEKTPYVSTSEEPTTATSELPANTWTSTGGWSLYTNNDTNTPTYAGGTSASDLSGLVYHAKWKSWGSTDYLQATPNTTYTAGSTYDYTIKVKVTDNALGANAITLRDGPANSTALRTLETKTTATAVGETIEFTGQWTPRNGDTNPHLYIVHYSDAAPTLTVTQYTVTKQTEPPVAPASVTATRGTSAWNAINISFTAGSNPPAGQTYSIEVDDVEIENNASPGTTYSTTIDYDEDITVEVIAHNDGQTDSTSTTINIPEYKPLSQFNGDAMNTDYQEYYGDHTNIVYKIDSNGVHLKNTNQSGVAGMNLIYKGSLLSEAVPYYPEFYYTSDTADTQNISYGIFTNDTIPKGSRSKTTSTSGENNFGFLVTPTAEQVAANAKAYINWNIPAGAEFTLTRTTGYKALDPRDAVGVTASSTNANEVTVTWTDDHCPSYQIYEIALFDSNGTQVGSTVEEGTMYSTYTFTNVPKGSNYTVNIKARVDQVYASASGVTSNTVNVNDPAPVAPTSVTATRSTTVWNGVNVSFAADPSAPAGQTYSIEVDGNVIENNATPGQTYSTTVSYGTGIDVDVIAHSNGQTATTSTTVDVPEYKPFSQFNGDSLNTDYQEFYGDHARVVYKIDSNGDVHLKNTDSEAAAGMNFIYKKYGLTSAESYLVTYTYTSDTAGTQNVPYGVFTNNTAQQGSMSHTTSDTGTNTLQFMVEPTAEQVAANAKAYFNWTVPAGAEVVITGCTLTSSNPPEDVTAVGVSNNTPNQIGVTLTKPSPSQAPTNQVYEIYLTNTSTGTTSYVDSIAYNESSYTITNVPKGNYTVTVKAKVASTYASAGVTSSAIDVHDPAPVAPASVTANETSNKAYSIDVSFAAGSNPPAGQNYSIAFVDSDSHEYEVKAAGTAVPGTTYTIEEMNGAPIPVGTYTVKVYAHNDGTTAVTTTTATVQWNRAANTWDTTKIGDWEFFGTYDGTDNWGQLGYKGSTFDNMQVKAINPSGAYTLQMRIDNEDLYAGLVDGKVYNFSLKFKSTAAGTVKWTQHYYQNEQTLAVTDYSVSGTVNEMQSTFKYDQAACEAGETPYFNIELSTLPQGAVLYDFDLDIDILDWQPLAANETVSCGTGTALYSDGNANSMAYYNGSNTSWSNVRIKHLANALPAEWAYVNTMNIDNATLYKINGTSMEIGHKYRMTMSYSAPGTTGGRIYVQQNGCSHFTGDNYDVIDGSTGQIQRDFVYDNTAEQLSVFFGGMDYGVEVTNIQFTFVELPQEVVSLNASSNTGTELMAAWADPVAGLSQTYKVSLYDATGTTPIAGKTDIPVSAKNYTFTGLDANTTYTVKVVSTLGGIDSNAVSTTGTTSEWIQMGNGTSQATTDGKANIYTEWGNLAYYYNSLGSLNTLQLKRTSGAEADENYWWYYKVEQTNANAYSTLVNGHRYTMTVSYNTNAEATGTIKLKQNFGEAIETKHNVVAGRTGENKDSFTVDFIYDSSYGSNLTELMLGGLGNGTIISNITYSFVEQESWDSATNNEWVDVGNYGYYTSEPEGETLNAQYSTSAGYPLSIKGNLGGWEGGGRYRVGTSRINAKPNSAYNYSITLNRSDNYAGSTATLLADFGNGKAPTILGTMSLADAGSANAAFTGKVVLPSDAKYVRIYGQFTWERANEKFSVVSYNLTPIAEFDLTNDGTNVVADWSELNIAPAKLTYTSEGVDYEVTSFVDSTYTFSAHYPDNGSEVLLLDNNDEILARVVAFADLTITKVFINRPEGQETDGVIHANTNNTVNVFVKNIGVARANSNTVQDIYVKVSHDDWYNHAFDKDTILLPNQDVEEKVYGLRYSEPGTYSIECTVNDGYVILESSVDNNSTTKQFEIDTQIEDDTAVLGFQINTNKAEGSPSEFNPSYRTVCRASKRVYPVGGPAEGYAVTNYGFIYALTEQADLDDPFNQMRLSEDGGQAGTNEYIKSYQAQSTLDLDEWTTKDGSTYNNDNSYFYALTIYDKYYTTDQYETNYTYRSYLQYRDNNNVLHTVYPKDIYSASLYEIAEDLYKFEKMPTKGSHDFLYDNILNIVSMKHNHQAIAMDMMTKLHSAGKMPSASSPNYRYCNMINKDLTYYALCSDPKGHTPAEDPQYAYMIYRYSKAKAETGYENYTHDDQFTSIQLSEAGGTSTFVNDLNYCTDSDYETVFDWIYNEIDHDKGFYKKVAYEWDTNLDKDYGTE